MTAEGRALLAEFVGTAVLLLAIVGSGVAGATAGSEALHLFVHAVVVGLVLVGLVSAFATTSGAHFNPAVTVADAALGNRSWGSTLRYLAAQATGAVVGVVVANATYGLPAVASSDNLRTGAAMVSSEVVATFVLVLVIFRTVAGDHARSIPTVVGATVAALIFATPSTALMNPAVTIARTLTDSWTGVRLVDAGPYVLAQLAGAVLAVVVARLLRAPDRAA